MRWPRSSRNGSRSIIRCGFCIRAAPPVCPRRSFMGMAASSSPACAGHLHLDLGASYSPNTFGERFHWYTATGWVMWNMQVGALLAGTTICLFDGSPSGAKGKPDWRTLWAFAARHRVTWFGAGAAFFSSCRKAGITVGDAGDLSAIRALGSTGSPLPADVQRWGTDQFAAINRPEIWWCNISGGTDIAAAFFGGQSRVARHARQASMPPSRRRRRSMERGRARRSRAGGRARLYASVSKHASLLLGRRRRQPVSIVVLSRVAGNLATRRLVADRGRRELHDHRQKRRDHQSPRAAHGDRRYLFRRGTSGRGLRQPGHRYRRRSGRQQTPDVRRAGRGTPAGCGPGVGHGVGHPEGAFTSLHPGLFHLRARNSSHA